MTKGIKGCKNLRHGGLIWQDVTPDRGRWPTLQTLISAIFGEKKRLTKLAAAMAESPGKSLPQQCGRWADLKAAYRLLSHPAVTPEQITATHRQRTRRGAQVLPIVLSVQDTTDLDYTHRTAVRGLGNFAAMVAAGDFVSTRPWPSVEKVRCWACWSSGGFCAAILLSERPAVSVKRVGRSRISGEKRQRGSAAGRLFTADSCGETGT